MKMIPGLKLPSALQRQALAFYVHRYTRDHTPSWVAACPRLDGKPYPVQFASDSEWLEHTLFPVHRGALTDHPCQSTPTWPDEQGD
jgi:hypothetical protein